MPALGAAALCTTACGLFESHDLVVLNNDLIIPNGGGSAEVTFLGLAGQTLAISLVGQRNTMVPFATLVSPSGGQVAAPPASSAVDNTNTADVTLTLTGTYRLLVFDDSGRGGTVTVRIER